MTSLIDVIFLLLLFFMLSSTFSRFGEIPLVTGGHDGAVQGQEPVQTVLLRLNDQGLTVNGVSTALDAAEASLRPLIGDADTRVLISLASGANAQDLVQVLHRVRRLPKAKVVVVN